MCGRYWFLKVHFVAENPKQIAKKLGLEGKFSYVHMTEFRNFQFWNARNKTCVHTWDNSTSYSNKHENWDNKRWEITNSKSYLNQLFYLTNQRAIVILCNAFCKYNIMCTNTSPKQSSYCIKLCYSSFKTYCAVCTHGDVLGLVFKRMHTLV
jgi:hypothetical protein